ncbi:MAG: precorrin-3B C(17)-methyltransferase [Dehalococcoidia bacterium]|nr:precorrin-3B C(17)-methyltransferase [Dehalococcoidia bacterium]
MSAKIFLVGIGPGQAEHITHCAQAAIERASIVIGHPDNLAQIAHMARGKEIITINQNPLERSRAAVEKALNGQDVVIVSSGDPGIYAIAATFLDYLRQQNLMIETEIVPGLGLAVYASARLGAALGSDSASISLCDQNTPWTTICRRLSAAISADFVMVIYNPFGKLGATRLEEAIALIQQERHLNTPVGVLSQASTPDEKLLLTTLGELPKLTLPTDTLIIIGNSQSYVYGNYMITPRLYKENIGY